MSLGTWSRRASPLVWAIGTPAVGWVNGYRPGAARKARVPTWTAGRPQRLTASARRIVRIADRETAANERAPQTAGLA